jgi:hypothetical protein
MQMLVLFAAIIAVSYGAPVVPLPATFAVSVSHDEFVGVFNKNMF